MDNPPPPSSPSGTPSKNEVDLDFLAKNYILFKIHFNCPHSPSRTPQATLPRLEKTKPIIQRALYPATCRQWPSSWTQSKLILLHYKFPI